MSTVRLTNDFHGTAVSVRPDAAGTVSGDVLARAGSALCPVEGCTCSGWMGTRGPQEAAIEPIGREDWYGRTYRAARYRLTPKNPAAVALGRISTPKKAAAAVVNGRLGGRRPQGPYYTTWGPVRGDCGHAHLSVEAAQECLDRDAEGCRSQGGYSDREIRRIERKADVDRYDVTRGPGRPVR